MDEDDLMMTALDAGAEDFAAEEDSYEIVTDPDDFLKSGRPWKRSPSRWPVRKSP